MPYTPEEMKPLSTAERLQFGLTADAGAVSKPTPSNAPVEMPDSFAAPAAKEPDFSTSISNYVQLLNTHYKHSDESIAEGFSYYNAAIGLDTYEGVKSKTNQVAQDARRASEMTAVEALVPPHQIGRVILPLVQALPYIKHSMEATALGSMTTGGTAALAGGALGGLAGAGVAGGVGMMLGGPAAAFTYTATQSTGAKYKEFREAGIPHPEASRYALAHGTVQGAIEAAQTFLITKTATKAFGAVMKSPGGVKLMRNAVYKFLGGAAMEGAEEGSQEVADIIINHMASKQFNIPTLSDESKWGQRVTQSIVAGAFIGGTFNAGAHIGGALTAKAARVAIDGKKGTFADTVREILQARDAAVLEDKNALKAAAIKSEIPTTLKQAITQAEATMKVTGKISTSKQADFDTTVAKTTVEVAESDLDKAKTKYRAAQAMHKFVSEDVNNALQADGVVSETLQGQLDESIKLEDEAELDYRAAKLALTKTKIHETLKTSGLSDAEIATLKKREDEIRVKERKIKLEVAHRSLGRQAAKLDTTLHALHDEITSRKTEKENKKDGLFKKWFGNAKPLNSTGNKKKDKKNSKNHFREDGAPKNTLPVVDEMIAAQKAAIDKTLPTKQLEEQAAKVKDRRDTLRLMQELIEQDLLSNAEIAELRHAIPAGRAKELVNLAISKLYSSARDIAWSTKEKVKTNQKILRDLILQSGLSEQDQARFLKQIPQVQSPTDLRRIMDDTEVKHEPGTKAFKEHGPTSKVLGLNTLISNLLEVRAKEDAMSKLQKTISEAEPRKNSTGKYSRFSRAGQLQFYLDTIESMINPTKAQVNAEAAKGGDGNATDRAQKANIEAALAKRDNTVDPIDFTTDDAIRESAARSVGVLSESKAADVRQLNAFLKDVISKGLKERADQLAVENAAQDVLNTKVETGIMPMLAKTVSRLNALAKEKKWSSGKTSEAKKLIREILKDSGLSVEDHDRFTDLMNNIKSASDLQAVLQDDEVSGDLGLSSTINKQIAKQVDVIIKSQNSSEKPRAAQRVMQYMKSSGATVFSWDGMLDILFQDLHPNDRKELKEQLDLGRHLNAEKGKFNRHLDTMHTSMAKAAGMSVSQLMKHSIRSTKQQISIDWVDSMGNEVTTGLAPEVNRKGIMVQKRKNLTVDIAQDMLMQMRDGELSRSVVEGNGFTLKGMKYVARNADGSVKEDADGNIVFGAEIPHHLTTEGALETALRDSAPNDVNLKVLDGLREFYQSVYKEMAAEYYLETGLTLADNPNYSGPALHNAAVNENIMDSFKAEMKARYSNKGTITGRAKSTRTRVDSGLALKFQGIYGKATTHAAHAAHWVAWRTPSKFISKSLTNARTKSLIEFKYGEGFYKNLELHISDSTIGRIERHDDWLKHYNNFLSKMGPLVLLGKLQQFPKQLTGMTSALLEMGGVDLARGIYDFHENIDEATKTLMESDAFRNRYDGTLNTWQGALIQRSEFKTTEDAINKFLGMGLIEGDKYVSLQIAWAKYQAELRSGTSKDMAMERAWNLVERTQSSGRMDQLSNVAKSAALKGFTIFKQQPTRANEFIATAHRDFMNGHIGLDKVIATHIVTRMAQVAFVAVDVALALIVTTDPEEIDKLYLQLWQQLAIGPTGPLGDVWAIAYTLAQNEVLKIKDGSNAVHIAPREIKVPAAQFVDNGRKLVENYIKAMDDGSLDWEEFLILWGNYAKSIQRMTLTPLDKYPTEPTIKLLKAVSGVEGDSIKPPKMME